MITLNDIQEAQTALKGVVHYTPLSHAPILSKQLNANIYLKKENLQLTGSFKIRGAFNKVQSLSDEEKAKGIVAASAGNHAQGLAYAAQYFGIEATIVMPEATPLIKVLGVKSFGGNVVLKGANFDEDYVEALKIEKDEEKVFVHPFNDDKIIAGQGTVALEILEQIEDIDIIVISIGGGGLISGMATAIRALKPSVKIIGVVAAGANAMKKSFDSKTIINSTSVKTIADGIAVRDVTPRMYDYVSNLVDEIIEVEEQEIAAAILFLLEKQKIVVEGAGAIGLAALMHNQIEIEGKTVVIPLSGGNIDVTMLSLIIEKGLVTSSRKMNMLIKLVDKPGSLMKLTNIFVSIDANIVQMDFNRNSLELEFGEAYLTLSLETKGVQHQEKVREKLKEHGFEYNEI
jgi:threonine dehydratase